MKLWGGRFAKETDQLAYQFNASLSFDVRLYDEDITCSKAWARGLAAANILTESETAILIAGLEKIRREIEGDTFAFVAADEDIHTAVERRLSELVGPLGGKLHTGRSRNDQVATDFRLWTMRAIDRLQESVGELGQALLDNARANLNLPLPGYTHLQHAQPVTWGHWVLSHLWPLIRDTGRLGEARERAAVLPLGSAALAGTAFPIDRRALADELGFADICQNSLDGVSDRDFVADFLYVTTMIGLHLSRLSEQLIIFNSAEFGFVTLDDGYSTGSSIMPQKKNPDTLELTRGKAGRLLGNLTGWLATMKGLPSTYDKDLQEDKEPVFDAYDTISMTLPVMAGLIRTLRLRPERMAAQLDPGLLATDLADYLVRRGLPFREAHEMVGKAVQMAEERQVPLSGLSLEELRSVSERFDADVAEIFDVQESLASRAAAGGTAPEALQAQLEAAEAALAQLHPGSSSE
jgi:argininosuccinate lyase